MTRPGARTVCFGLAQAQPAATGAEGRDARLVADGVAKR